MRAHPRAGALVFGIVLICIGTIFLLQNWYPGFSAWRWLARYWPLILILVGAKKLYGHFTYREGSPDAEIRPKG